MTRTRVWPFALVVLLAGCSSNPMPPTGMMPPPPGYYDGAASPSANGPMANGPMAPSPFDESLNRPLQAGGPAMGLLAQRPGGLLDAPPSALDMPVPDASGTGALSQAGDPNSLAGSQSDTPAGSQSDTPVTSSVPQAPPAITSKDDGKQPHHEPVLIATHLRTDPDAIRIRAAKVGTSVDVTVAVPMTADITFKHKRSDTGKTLKTDGVATARLRLAPAGDHTWKPSGIGVMTSRTTAGVPFAIRTLTIAADGHEPWTITDPTAITALDALPNIAPGTQVTVTVSLSGDTATAMPMLVADGRLMHLPPTDSTDAAATATGRTYSRTFTLKPWKVSIGRRLTVSKETGMIGVKVLDLSGMADAKTDKPPTIRSIGWAVSFPSQDSGKAKGFAVLQNAERLQRHVTTLLQVLDQQEGRPIQADLTEQEAADRND